MGKTLPYLLPKQLTGRSHRVQESGISWAKIYQNHLCGIWELKLEGCQTLE